MIAFSNETLNVYVDKGDLTEIYCLIRAQHNTTQTQHNTKRLDG
jgi:hypothetical protein